jgi:hypothetical protein
VKLAGNCEAKACDLSTIIDVEPLEQVQGGEGRARNKGVEVRHNSVLPEEGTGALANSQAFVVNAEGEARNVPRKRAEVGDQAILPKEAVSVGEGPD